MERVARSLCVLGPSAVAEALPMAAAIVAMREAFTAIADGSALDAPRLSLELPPDLVALGSAAAVPGEGVVMRVATINGQNRGRGLPGRQGLCVVFDPTTGTPIAAIDGTALGARRCGAASGLATDLLARRDAQVAAIVGCGPVAREQLLGIDAVRDFEEIRVAGSRAGSATALAAELDPVLRARVIAVDDVAAAVADADVVCTATTSREPVLRARQLAPGCHVNSFGSIRLDMRELDADVFAGARVFVDHVESAAAEAGHLVAAERDGATRRAEWTLIGDVLRKVAVGRTADDERSVFVSIDQAALDAVAALAALAAARARELGQNVDWR